MSSPRPICKVINYSEQYMPPSDVMILGRSKTKYYGAYPAGFLERARTLLTASNYQASLWHVPGGMAKDYNGIKGGITLRGFGPNDITIDLNPECKPDILMDVRELHKLKVLKDNSGKDFISWSHTELFGSTFYEFDRPDAIIVDLPYTPEEAENYAPGKDKFPNVHQVTKECLRIVKPFGLVGVLDFVWPDPGPEYKEIYFETVATGRKNKPRTFIVFQQRFHG